MNKPTGAVPRPIIDIASKLANSGALAVRTYQTTPYISCTTAQAKRFTRANATSYEIKKDNLQIKQKAATEMGVCPRSSAG